MASETDKSSRPVETRQDHVYFHINLQATGTGQLREKVTAQIVTALRDTLSNLVLVRAPRANTDAVGVRATHAGWYRGFRAQKRALQLVEYLPQALPQHLQQILSLSRLANKRKTFDSE